PPAPPRCPATCRGTRPPLAPSSAWLGWGAAPPRAGACPPPRRPPRGAHTRNPPRHARRDSPPAVKKKLPPAEPVAPARLEALRYLPPRTGVVAGIHVHELLAGPAADDVRGRPIMVGGIELQLDKVKEVTGLDAEDVEHV